MHENERDQQMERIELKGPLEICIRSHPMQSRIITFTAVMICCFQLASTCQYTHTLTSNNTVCTRTDGSLKCRYIMESRITLSEHRPHACFRIRHDNKTIGSLEVQLQHVILQCNPEVLFYTRDASIITESAKRCHFAGSCSSDTCAHTSTRSYVPELHNTYEYPGTSRCTSSCGSVGCGCLLPIPGCLFSRSFSKPRNEKVYEIFNCPTWEESAIMKYTYTGAKGKEETNIVRVEAQTTHEEKDGNITVEFITTPNVPLLSTVFLRAVNSGSQETSIVDRNDIFALRCPTMDSARNLSLCHIEDTCECFPTDTEANCRCKNTNITEKISSIDSRLPLSTSVVQLQEASGRILAVSHKSIVDLTITTNGEWKSDNIVNNEDCDISASPVRGCYNCLTGAQLTFSCHSKYPTMVEVVCTDHMFAAACDRFTAQTEATLHSTAAQFVDQCKVTCGRRVYAFNITGTLAYHPHMEVVRFSNDTEDASYVNMYNYPDIGHIISVALSSWKMMAVAVLALVVLVGLTALCIPRIIGKLLF